METPSISPHISSLAASLSAVPPAAAPSIVDCVLASSALPPSLLLSSLLQAFPNLTEADHPSRALSYTGALCHLAGKTDGLAAFGDLIWRAFLPLLKRVDANDSELLSKILGFLCDALSKTQFWELAGETLVPFSLRSVGLSVGLINSGELAVYRWSREDSFEVEGTLPVMVACRVLTSLLECALRDVGRPVCLVGFAANLVWDLSTLALGMLLRSPEDGSVAVRMLLPSVFGAFTMFDLVGVSVCGSPYTLSRRCFSEKIWKCSLSLFSLGQIERLDAYNVLSLYFSFHRKQQNEETLVGINGKEFDITNEKEFWEELRRGLVDKDASLRKQALYILKASLSYYSSFMGRKHDQCSSFESASTADAQNAKIVSDDGATSQVGVTKRAKWAEKEAKSLGVGELSHLVGENCSSSQDRWKVFLLLYEMLEEYGTHLVEAAWNHQVFLLFQSQPLNNCSNPKTCGVYQVQMETVEGIFSWLAVLWERGFFHENPQVRCLIMQSFLDIEWDKHGNCARMVPRSFLLGPFMLGLNDAVHHKDFGVKGLYTSRAIKGATKYIAKFSSQLSLSEHVEFVWSLASVARQESFGRAGLMALAFCIAAACRSNTVQERGAHYSMDSSHISYLESAQRDFLPVRAEDLLDVLGIVIERSKQHFNPNYRLQVCEQVLGAASSVLSIFDVPLDRLLHFLAIVPREFTDRAGPLREIVQQWLTQISFKGKSPGLMTYENSEAQVLENLISFPTCFIKHNNSPDGSISFDDEDVDAWIVGAQRWSRVLFLAIKEAQHLEPIIMFFQNHCSSLCKQESKRDWVPAKVIILLLCLVEEFQVECANATFCSEKKAERESGRTRILDQSCPLITSVDFDKFFKSFSSILVDLLSFAKLASPIFWSVSMVKDTPLPGSVKGKLGGPSQRRLPSYTTASVLQAILSLRTVACISSWCSEQRRHDCNDSSFPFLWEFTWKVIQSQSYNSETSAELCLAAYEALASVLKGLSTAFTPLVFNFIFAYNRSKFFNGEDRPLLDPLTLAFFNNINDILSNGKLTRSRRAVLMSWKWNCLASLLSVPYNYIENGVHARNSFFSDSTLRRTFADTVESLENAGESSILFMLRAVRLVLGLLCSAKTSSMIACSGVDCQMMLQLVRSSWVLHLSCNKRRVASIAALLSAVLHESVFSDMTMHETNGSERGPIKWFIENLLAEGVKSPRTIRLAALHLTGLWLLHPKTVKYYIKELKLLALYGSVAFDEDFAAELNENHEARTEVSLLAESPDPELTEVFINTELYARVSVAALFYKLASLANNKREQENEDSVAALHCGKMFLLEMLDTAANDKDITKELYKKYSAVHRRKVRAWQMICILSHFVEKDILKEVTSNMHICLYKNNLPAVRQYLETFAIQVYLKFPTLAEAELVPIFYNYNMRPQALSSYVFIAANLILHASDLPVQIKHFNELLPPIFPFLTSHHHSLRAFTQLLVHHILCKLWHVFEPITSEIAPLEKKCFVDLKSYLTENSDCFRLRASMEGFLYAFDPKTSATPAGTFDARNEGSEFECVPVSLMEQVINFLNEARDDLRHSIAKDAMTIKNESLMVAYACEDRKKASQTPKDISLDFQKKITLNDHVRQGLNIDSDWFLGNAELSKLLSEMEKEDELLNSAIQSRNQALEMIRGSQQQFILVASLIDRIPNLAGLARTCEVFKAAGLAVADSSIIQDKQFQLISVTAEKWVPMIEVPVCSLKVFLEKKRREGYSILGLEQTANSIPLDKYSFPNKMVLVLGREKEGIPVDIIHVLDACIEIPQLGIVRSLNVHVSGAIALWEYTRQQRSKQL